MRQIIKAWLRNPYVKKIAGVLLIFFGILGLVLPFLQGVLMIVAGLTLLGNKSAKKYALRLKDWVARKKKKR